MSKESIIFLIDTEDREYRNLTKEKLCNYYIQKSNVDRDFPENSQSK